MKPLNSILLLLLLASCSAEKTPIDFEKIVFHTSPCFGNCPIINLQVNKDKSILLYKNKDIIKAKVGEGSTLNNETEYFKGTVSDELYKELLTEIAKTDTISYKGQNCCDAPLKTMISYYNGKRKYSETMFPPKEAEKLISILYEIAKSKNLAKTEKFEIEDVEPHKVEFKKEASE